MVLDTSRSQFVERGSMVRRLLNRWLLSLSLVFCLFAIEGAALWMAGFRYQDKETPTEVWIPKNLLSSESHGKTFAAQVYLRRKNVETALESYTVLLNPTQGKLTRISTNPDKDTTLALSPCGQWLVQNHPAKQLEKTRLADGQKLSIAPEINEYIFELEFSPCGNFLAALSEDSVFVLRWPDGQLCWKQPLDDLGSRVLRFSEDSKQLLVMTDREHLNAKCVATGSTISTFPLAGQNCLEATWSDTHENWILVLEERQGISIREAGTQDPIAVFSDAETGPSYCLVASSSQLAYATIHREIKVHSLHDGSIEQIIQAASGSPFHLFFSADDSITCIDEHGVIRQYDLEHSSPVATSSLCSQVECLINAR